MKSTLSILVLLITINLYPQVELMGEYCSLPRSESDVICIDFQEKNRFEYKRSGCMGESSFGEGVYELKSSTLRLIFDKKEKPVRSTVDITEKPSLSDQEVVFEFNIKDQYGGTVFVFATEKGDNKDIGIDPEKNKITLPKSNVAVHYEIHAVGYETIVLALQPNSDKVIDITLFEGQPKPISGQTISWELYDIKQDEFKTGEKYWHTMFRKVQK